MQVTAVVRGGTYPGVHGAVEPHRSISNSVVKRSSGDDSWGVAPCENSSMPGKTCVTRWGRKGEATRGGWLFCWHA